MVIVSAPEGKKKRGRRKNTRDHVEKEDATINDSADDSSSMVVDKSKHRGWKSIVVPKRGSMLSLLIPLGAREKTEKPNIDKMPLLLDGTERDMAKPPVLVIDFEDAGMD